MTKTLLPLTLLLAAIAGCSPDERVVDIATTAADRQAEQNEEIVRLNREVAQGTRQLVEADAKAREDFAQLHQALQSERAELGEKFNDLEAERKSIAQARRTESLVVPVAKALGIVLLAIVVIGFCWSLLFGIQKSDDHAELNELLIREITAERPMLLPPTNQERQSLPSPEETTR